jgi:hypothetical protein
MFELDRFVVANKRHIPCTIRTLKPFRIEGDGSFLPWVPFSEVGSAILYLAEKTEQPPEEIHALKELLERLSCSINGLSDSQAPHPDGNTTIKEQ